MDNKVKIRTRYERSPSKGLRFARPTRTKQEYAGEANINNLVARFKKTGQLPQAVSQARAFYGDFSNVVDYQQAMNSAMIVEDQFMSLPAVIRAKFDNDPAKLLEFLDNPENAEEAARLGLINGNTANLDVSVPVDTKPVKPAGSASQQGPASEAGGKSPEASSSADGTGVKA